MNWRLVIDVTAESREGAEAMAALGLENATLRGPNGGTSETTWDKGTCRMECGDPGLAHRPQDVDLATCPAVDWDAVAEEQDREAAMTREEREKYFLGDWR